MDIHNDKETLLSCHINFIPLLISHKSTMSYFPNKRTNPIGTIIYIYIYILRERERERDVHKHNKTLNIPTLEYSNL
jgi:hypothetical protein